MARSTTAARPIRNTLGRFARPSQRPIPGYSLPESRALRRIIKLQREVERELGIWSAPECLAKIEEMESLIRAYFKKEALAMGLRWRDQSSEVSKENLAA